MAQLNSNQAALIAAAKDLVAIEVFENGMSPIALSVIFSERCSGVKLRPNEVLLGLLGEKENLPRSSYHEVEDLRH